MFKTATLVPIQAKMIDMNLISSDEVCLEFLGFFFFDYSFCVLFPDKIDKCVSRESSGNNW